MQVQSVKNFFNQFYDIFLFGFLILVSIILIFQPISIKNKIAKTIGFPFLVPTEKFIHTISLYHQLKTENDELKKAVAHLNLENIKLRSFETENNRLSALMGFMSDYEYETIAAQVVAYDSKRVEKSFIANKGLKNNIDRNWAVVTLDGIIGKTLVVNDYHSVIQLLQDRNCKVSVIDLRSREVGILTWTPEQNFYLDYISPQADISEGDSLITSGYGGIFPKNLPVGKVIKTKFNQQRQQLEAYVELFADLNKTEEVIIISPFKKKKTDVIIAD